MKHLFLIFPFLLATCATSTFGVVVDKYQDYKTKIMFNLPLDSHGHVYHKATFKYPKKYWVSYRDKEGKSHRCEVSETIYNITNVGENFDCSVLGKDALDRAVND